MTSTLVGYYERWVNGSDLAWKRRLFNRWKAMPPASVPFASQTLPNSDDVALQLVRYLPASARSFVAALPDAVPSPIHAIIVHGSQATDSPTCDFSDVDVMVILDDRTSHSRAGHTRAIALLQWLLKQVYTYDPLMHHGLMFFPCSGLYAYDQAFLPIETLRLAKSLGGTQTLSLTKAPADLGRISARLSNSIISLRRSFRRGEYRRSDYQLKRILSGILLLPTVILATRGEFVYKIRSFELAKELFNDSQWDLIALAEEMRMRWRRPATSRITKLLISRLHPQVGIDWVRRFGPSYNAAHLIGEKQDRLAEAAPACLDRLDGLLAKHRGASIPARAFQDETP